MKKGKGGAPIAPIRPQRPVRPNKMPPGTLPSQKRPPSMAPPPARRKKTSIVPQRDSTDKSIAEFFREKPDSEPPSGRRSVEIDIDAEMQRPSGVSSIPVEFADPDSEALSAPARRQDAPGEPLQGFEGTVQKLSMLLNRLKPSAEGEFSFNENGIFLGHEKIGTVVKSRAGIKMRVWMHKLGFGIDSLPASTIFGLFRIQDFFFADAKARAGFVSVYAENNESRDNIKLCFHKEEAEASFLSAPLQVVLPAKKS
ncbi:hypothetical protein GF412_04085 [Candidatus Micrarchaeota archaeon]|nr:hypothetical protein [Candidatus Micrarchaeota archaeon]MBD3418129.1 hypothetical protein [Candidatus Micrarchaeota archaeon]